MMMHCGSPPALSACDVPFYVPGHVVAVVQEVRSTDFKMKIRNGEDEREQEETKRKLEHSF